MFQKRTVIVVGAGASTECGIPDGPTLKGTISSLLNFGNYYDSPKISGDKQIIRAIQNHVKSLNDNNSINSYLTAGSRIHDAMPLAISIDNFLEAHADDEKIRFCGKLAIVKAIVEAEKRSKLYFENYASMNKNSFFSIISKTWYGSFFQLLSENAKFSDLQDRFQKIFLIIFNYDRCIEHFLHCAIQNYYGVSAAESAECLSELRIHHPYGSIGPLPWQSNLNSIRFGDLPPNFMSATTRIKTFSEGTDPNSSGIDKMREEIDLSEIVVFLGFAFHKQNIELLRASSAIPATRAPFKKYFGTAKGVSSSDRNSVEIDIRNICSGGRPSIELADVDCADFFQRYWRSLSIS